MLPDPTLIAISLAFLVGVVWLGWRKPRRAELYLPALILLQGVLTVAYLVIDSLSGDGINEAVVYSLAYGLKGAGLGDFLYQVTVSAAGLLVTIVLACLTYFLLRRRSVQPPPKPVFIALLSTVLLSVLLHPAVTDLVQLGYSESFKPSASFSKYFRRPLLPRRNPDAPNIVYIYGESLERTYLDESIFPGLMPNFHRLEGEGLSFTNISQRWGTGWTIGGMVASQCGMPLVTTGSKGNTMGGMDQFLPRATCLGDLLRGSGYALSFMGGAPLSFAGKGKFYETHGFTEVRGRETLESSLADRSYETSWGLYDDTLLDLAFKRFERLSAERRKFGLFLITLDTHHPEGHVTRSCGALKYRDGSNPMLNAVACTDRLIAAFIDRIESSPYAGNTIVVLASDHLAMPNTARSLLEKGNRRDLLEIFYKGHLKPRTIDKAGSTLDVAPTLLGLLGHKVPALGFGRDLLEPTPTLTEQLPDFDKNLASWSQDLRQFWSLPSLDQGIVIDPKKRTALLDGRTFRVPLLATLGPQLEVKQLMFGLEDENVPDDVAEAGASNPILWIDDCQEIRLAVDQLPPGGLCAFAGYLGGQHTLIREAKEQPQIDTAALEKALVDRPPSAGLLAKLAQRLQIGASNVADFELGPDALQKPLLLRSFGGPNNRSGVADGDDPTKSKLSLRRGFSLIGFEHGGEPHLIEHLDTCSMSSLSADDEARFSNSIKKTAASGHYDLFAILIHDSAVCHPLDLQPLFEGLPLREWAGLRMRTPYVALVDSKGNRLNEFVAPPGASLAVHLLPAGKAERAEAGGPERTDHN